MRGVGQQHGDDVERRIDPHRRPGEARMAERRRRQQLARRAWSERRGDGREVAGVGAADLLHRRSTAPAQVPPEAATGVRRRHLVADGEVDSRRRQHLAAVVDAAAQPHLPIVADVGGRREQPGVGADPAESVVGVAVVDLAGMERRAPAPEVETGPLGHPPFEGVALLGDGERVGGTVGAGSRCRRGRTARRSARRRGRRAACHRSVRGRRRG